MSTKAMLLRSQQMSSLLRSRCIVRPGYNTASRMFSTSQNAFKIVTIKVPHLADSITEGAFKGWQKQVGEAIKLDEEVGSIETDKVDIPVNSTVAGVMVKQLIQQDDVVVVGQDMCEIDTEGEATSEPAASSSETVQEKPVETVKEASTPAPTPTPAPKPVEQAKPAAPAPAPAAKPTPQPKVEAPVTEKAPAGSRQTRVEKMSRMRLRISERLKESQNTLATLTTFNEIDMSNLMALRSKYKDAVFEKHGIKLGFMGAFAKACAQALKEVPAVNARISNDGQMVEYHDYSDISVAVATPKGLVTPIVRGVEQMNIVEIEQEIKRLGDKARDNKLTLEDLNGGTFTISNGGVFGSLMGTPIINLPQSAILGMHAIKERPVVVEKGGVKTVEVRPMMYVALSYDHRLIDGREAVTFLVKVRDYVQDPSRLLLEV